MAKKNCTSIRPEDIKTIDHEQREELETLLSGLSAIIDKTRTALKAGHAEAGPLVGNLRDIFRESAEEITLLAFLPQLLRNAGAWA